MVPHGAHYSLSVGGEGAGGKQFPSDQSLTLKLSHLLQAEPCPSEDCPSALFILSHS